MQVGLIYLAQNLIVEYGEISCKSVLKSTSRTRSESRLLALSSLFILNLFKIWGAYLVLKLKNSMMDTLNCFSGKSLVEVWQLLIIFY